jgi:transcriptional regulator GlxA family with amidase domain
VYCLCILGKADCPVKDKQFRNIIATIQHIISQRGVVNVDDLVEKNFLSQRQFGRKFKAYTGFSRKDVFQNS